MIYTAGFQVLGGVSVIGLLAIWILAFIFGVWQYAQSKGRIGRALGSFVGAGLIATIFMYPDILTSDLPGIFKFIWDWINQTFENGGTSV